MAGFEDRGFGALRSARDVVAPRLEFKAGGRSSKADLRQWASPVKDQGKIGSCNACAAVSALEFLMVKTNQPRRDLSPLYVYYFGRKLAGAENEDAGLMCHHATAAVMAYGACEERVWPYRVEQFKQMPPLDAQENARRFDAVQYARLGSGDEAKMSLDAGVPVLFGLDIPKQYYHALDDRARMQKLGAFDHHPMTGHTMLIVGYDDEDRTWLAQNSWGPQFGEQGFVRIPYDVASRYTWNDELWAIGALERVERARLLGPSMQEAVADVQQNGVSQMKEALAKMGKEIARDLDKRVDDAKLSMRERMQAQEREIEARRKRDGQ
jgi:hypothetical protein